MRFPSIFITGIFLFFAPFLTHAEQRDWSEWAQQEIADLYFDLDSTPEEDLPQGFKVLDLVENREFSINNIKDPKQRQLANTVLTHFDRLYSREAMEQSPYQTYGKEQVLEFLFLINENGKVVGGVLWMYQDGRDEDGNESDINWQAIYRFDQTGAPLLDDNGVPFDDFYFAWSGF